MQLKWIEFNVDKCFETIVFGNEYFVKALRPWSSVEEWIVFGNEYFVKALRPWSSVEEWIVKSGIKPLRDGFKTKEEAMVAAHQIIEKELEKGYVGKDGFISGLTSKLSYIPEDMWGCKKALALFTNENGDEYIDCALISATIPKGSLVREVDPEHHNDLPGNGICRKCRSDRAIITDILEPMFLRPGESTNLPSRKTQRKKIPIISVRIVTLALKKYFIAPEGIYGLTARRMQHRDECAIMQKLMQGFFNIVLGDDYNAHIFGDWLSNITNPGFPVSLELAIAAKVLEPYMDSIARYQEDPYMLCKVLLARILRDIGIIDVALGQSYKIGDKIQIDDFDLSNNACGAGFHFFKTAIEAWDYKFN